MKLAQSRGSVALLSFAAKQEHPVGTIKAELMARIHANHETEQDYVWPVPQKAQAEARVAHATGAAIRGNTWWNGLVVPVAAALALVGLALSWRNRRVSQALVRQRQATQALLHEREETIKLVEILGAADTLTMKLAPAGNTAASGIVRYNGRMGMLAYSAQLPEASTGKTYQMWLVPATGTPISAGLIEKGSSRASGIWLAQVPVGTTAKAFAVTVEPAGGGPQPTGPKVLVGAS
jgi:anti-sigma-K factor RskA